MTRYESIPPRARREYAAAKTANQTAKKLGSPERIRVADVRRVLTDDARCAYCGITERLTLDHIVAQSAGGSNTPSNLQACCHACNTSKGGGSRPWGWSRFTDACVECGTTDVGHQAKGVCKRCYLRAYNLANPEQRKAGHLLYTQRRRERNKENKQDALAHGRFLDRAGLR